MVFDEFRNFKARLGATPATVRPLVLIIDDDPTIRASLELALSRQYSVQCCSSADEGVAALNPTVSVILLDVKMADKDGFAAYDELRAKDAGVPIIFHSAYQDLKNPYEIMNRYRPFGYITKGSESALLKSMLADAVRHREESQRARQLADELSSVHAKMKALEQRLKAR
jgi:DNA-binding NtrC family response regulator